MALFSIVANAQNKELKRKEIIKGFNYQMVIRDTNNVLLANAPVSIKIELSTYSGVEYTEIHTDTTDEHGVVSMVIGNGNAYSGNYFYNLNFDEKNYYMAVYINDILITNTMLRSVPYSEYSEVAGFANTTYIRDAQDVDFSNKKNGSVVKFDNENGYLVTDTVLFSVNGNVGIGDTLPTSKLSVKGDIKTSGEVNSTRAAGFNMLPIAYGMIKADGTISVNNTTTNVSCSKTGTGIYNITITDENYFYSKYIPMITPSDAAVFFTTNSIGGALKVNVINLAGAAVDAAFYFVVFKP